METPRLDIHRLVPLHRYCTLGWLPSYNRLWTGQVYDRGRRLHWRRSPSPLSVAILRVLRWARWLILALRRTEYLNSPWVAYLQHGSPSTIGAGSRSSVGAPLRLAKQAFRSVDLPAGTYPETFIARQLDGDAVRTYGIVITCRYIHCTADANDRK